MGNAKARNGHFPGSSDGTPETSGRGWSNNLGDGVPILPVKGLSYIHFGAYYITIWSLGTTSLDTGFYKEV